MQNHKLVQYTAHNAQVWYPISDLLHLRNNVLIGYAHIARGENLGLLQELVKIVYMHTET